MILANICYHLILLISHAVTQNSFSRDVRLQSTMVTSSAKVNGPFK